MSENTRERIERLKDQLVDADDREAVRIKQRIRDLKRLDRQRVT